MLIRMFKVFFYQYNGYNAVMMILLGGWRVSDKEVVWFDVRVDNSDAVEQLYKPEELGGEVEGERLNDGLVCVLGEVDQV